MPAPRGPRATFPESEAGLVASERGRSRQPDSVSDQLKRVAPSVSPPCGRQPMLRAACSRPAAVSGPRGYRGVQPPGMKSKTILGIATDKQLASRVAHCQGKHASHGNDLFCPCVRALTAYPPCCMTKIRLVSATRHASHASPAADTRFVAWRHQRVCGGGARSERCIPKEILR
jgi:hypothetical protein